MKRGAPDLLLGRLWQYHLKGSSDPECFEQPKKEMTPKKKPVVPPRKYFIKDDQAFTFWPVFENGNVLDARPKNALSDLMNRVCSHYDVQYHDIMGPKASPYIVLPRHVFFYQATVELGRSLTEVGDFAGKHHTSVLHGKRRIEKMLASGELHPETLPRVM